MAYTRHGGKLSPLNDGFELPSFVIETPHGAKKIIFDVMGNVDEIRTTTEKSQSLQEIKAKQDEIIKKARHMIDMGVHPEYGKHCIEMQHKMLAELERQSTLKASAEADSLYRL